MRAMKNFATCRASRRLTLNNPAIVLALTACCSACASADKPASKPATKAADREMVCAARMNADRATNGRGAVNWAIYDYCMKHPD